METSSPRTPKYARIPCNKSSEGKSAGLGFSSTPSSIVKGDARSRTRYAHRRRVFEDASPPKKIAKLCFSAGPYHLKDVAISQIDKVCKSLNNEKSNNSVSCSRECKDGCVESCGNSSVSRATEDGTVRVNLEFPHGGWDEDSSDERSSCGLEIVESEVESSPIKKGQKRTGAEICEEDSAILNGMGEEIERQLEAKAERNRLTVPNVKNILKSVITNPHVLAMVRRSMKNGNVAVSGDLDDFAYEPIITRAKAKQLLESVPEITWPEGSDMPWANSSQKVSPSGRHTLISHDFGDSDDDEEYKPFEDEPSDNDYSERDGSERGSERDISMEQSPAYFDTDNESCPPTPSPSPKPNIADCSTQTNWSEDGIFKVPKLPLEQQPDQLKEENIALRTRSKLPLNDTPLEEIEQAFIPPDITPDLYDTTCDNADWQEFLNEFMQPMRSEPHNNDDEEEDPEYNVLADEEIIDKEELRMDRAVKVSKRELNELMRELMEFTENLSSDDEEKCNNRNRNCETVISNSPSALDDFAFLEAYISSGSFTPIQTCKVTPQSTPTCNSGLNTPVPPLSPPAPRTSSSGKKNSSSSSGKDRTQLCSPNGREAQVLNEQNQIFAMKNENAIFVSSEDPEADGQSDFVCVEDQSNSKSGKITSKGKIRGSDERKTETVKRLSSGKNTPDEPSMELEESNNFTTSLPNIKSDDTTSTVPNSSSKSPLKSTIKDFPTFSFQDGILQVDKTSSALHISEPSTDEHLQDMNEIFCLSDVQKLVLDQQLRQHVQLLTQHFLQCYKHPAYNQHAAGCKEMLFTLKYLGESKTNSSFRTANLPPSLEVVSLWENTMLSQDGEMIISFWEKKVEREMLLKSRKCKYIGSFPPKLMEVVANSSAFVYPSLLPPLPFYSEGRKTGILNPSEAMLLTHAYGQFYPYVMDMYPNKRSSWHRKTMSLIAEHLMTTKNEDVIRDYFRKADKDNPVQYYRKYKSVPKTTHFIIPFDELQMKPLRLQPHNVLPKIWRDYIYAACD